MPETRPAPSPAPLWLPLLAGLAFGVRLIAIHTPPLWFDEGYSFWIATESVAQLIELTSLDIHPPLYYLTLHGWMALLGVGVWQARLLSVFAALLTVPLFYQLARRLSSERVARIATVLLAVAPLHVYYAQEVRMYALLMLLVVALLLAWQRRAWGWMGLFGGLALLTHYYAAWLLLGLALLLAWQAWRGAAWRGPARALSIMIVLFLPWALYSGVRLINYVTDKVAIESDRPLSLATFLWRHLISWTIGHRTLGSEWVLWGTLLMGGLALVGAWRLWQQRRGAILWLSGVVLVVAFLINLRTPFVDVRIERQLLYLLPLFLILVAEGIDRTARRWRHALPALGGLLAVVLVVALWRFYVVPRYVSEDYRPILEVVGAQQGPNDGWLVVYPWQAGYLRAYLPDRHPTEISLMPMLEDEAEVNEAQMEAMLTAYDRLWFPAYQVQGRQFEQKLVEALDRMALPVWNEWMGNTRLYLYGAPPPALPELAPLGEWSEQGQAHAALAGQEVESGTGVVPVFFQVAAPQPGTRASLQLVAQNDVWGEWDRALRSGINRAGLGVPPGTPPGSYEVRLRLYDETSTSPYNLVQNGQLTPFATLGEVTVRRPAHPLPAAALQQVAGEPMDVALGDAVRLLGYRLGEQSWQQGDRVRVTLFWQVQSSEPEPLTLTVQALDQAQTPRAVLELPLPTGAWQAGDLIRAPYTLPLPPDLAAGPYRLIVGLLDPATGERLTTEAGEISVPLASLPVAERARLMEGPDVGAQVDAPFGERARLAEVALPEGAARGEQLPITLLWQATQTGGAPLRSFVQLVTEEGAILSSDHPLDPPANAWVSGEWIVDEHTLSVPAGLPPGTYSVVAGLYNAESGEALPTSGGTILPLAEWTFP